MNSLDLSAQSPLVAPFLTEAEQLDELADLNQTWPLALIIKSQMDQPAHNIRTCVVIGSYKGKVMQWLLHHHHILPSLVVGFEPQKWATIVARERLDNYGPRWHINEYGLWIGDAELSMYNFGTDACSLMDGSNIEAIAPFKAIEPALKAIDKPIDLLIMNVEGAEFALLDVLLEDGPTISHLAVQFHEDYESVSALHHMIYRLNQHYTVTYPHALSSWGYWWN